MPCESDQVVPDLSQETARRGADSRADRLHVDVGDSQATQATSSGSGPSGSSAGSSAGSSRQLMMKLMADARPMSPAEIRVIRHLFTGRSGGEQR